MLFTRRQAIRGAIAAGAFGSSLPQANAGRRRCDTVIICPQQCDTFTSVTSLASPITAVDVIAPDIVTDRIFRSGTAFPGTSAAKEYDEFRGTKPPLNTGICTVTSSPRKPPVCGNWKHNVIGFPDTVSQRVTYFSGFRGEFSRSHGVGDTMIFATLDFTVPQGFTNYQASNFATVLTVKQGHVLGRMAVIVFSGGRHSSPTIAHNRTVSFSQDFRGESVGDWTTSVLATRPNDVIRLAFLIMYADISGPYASFPQQISTQLSLVLGR